MPPLIYYNLKPPGWTEHFSDEHGCPFWEDEGGTATWVFPRKKKLNRAEKMIKDAAAKVMAKKKSLQDRLVETGAEQERRLVEKRAEDKVKRKEAKRKKKEAKRKKQRRKFDRYRERDGTCHLCAPALHCIYFVVVRALTISFVPPPLLSCNSSHSRRVVRDNRRHRDRPGDAKPIALATRSS